MSITGISTIGREQFTEPKGLSWTMNCGSGSSPLKDISLTLLVDETPSAGRRKPAMLIIQSVFVTAQTRNKLRPNYTCFAFLVLGYIII